MNNMDNRQNEKPPLSALDQFTNLVDALEEEILTDDVEDNDSEDTERLWAELVQHARTGRRWRTHRGVGT
jgi:hypothetical protein